MWELFPWRYKKRQFPLTTTQRLMHVFSKDQTLPLQWVFCIQIEDHSQHDVVNLVFIPVAIPSQKWQSWFHSQQLQTYVYLVLEISLWKIVQGYMERFIVSQHVHLFYTSVCSMALISNVLWHEHTNKEAFSVIPNVWTFLQIRGFMDHL